MNALSSLTPSMPRAGANGIAVNSARIRTSTVDSIIDAIGGIAAAKLVGEFGGRRLYVPHVARTDDALARIIGARAAADLVRAFAGDRIMVPADLDRAHRRENIIAARRRGLSISAVAREIRCTERYVYKVLAQERQG